MHAVRRPRRAGAPEHLRHIGLRVPKIKVSNLSDLMLAAAIHTNREHFELVARNSCEGNSTARPVTRPDEPHLPRAESTVRFCLPRHEYICRRLSRSAASCGAFGIVHREKGIVIVAEAGPLRLSCRSM